MRSTARREPCAGGFSSTISLDLTKPVAMRKSRTALVMFASGSALSCRRRISAAAPAHLGSFVSMWAGIQGSGPFNPVERANLGYSGEWAVTMPSLWERWSSVVSRSYWLCSPIQNPAEFPKKRESSRAVSAVIDRSP